MKKFTILMSLFCFTIIAGSAFAEDLGFDKESNTTFTYDEFDNETYLRGGEGCVYSKNDWGFYNYSQGICMQTLVILPGRWEIDRVVAIARTKKFDDIAKLYVDMEFKAENWYFVEKVQARLGNKKFRLAGKFPRRVVISGNGIRESIRQPVDRKSDVYKNFWKPLSRGTIPAGTELTIRVTGENYYIDFKETMGVN
jgi:hypothetical protein